MSLELAAMRWLWIDRKCLVVLEQRSPRYGLGQPDVIGITPGRHLLEIEIKRSVRDFYADFDKPHRKKQETMPEKRGRQFYYLVTKEIFGTLKDKIPHYAGLMYVRHSYHDLIIEKIAPVNKESAKLNIHECARLSRQMTAHMMGYALAVNSLKDRWVQNGFFDHVDWVEAEKGTYTI